MVKNVNFCAVEWITATKNNNWPKSFNAFLKFIVQKASFEEQKQEVPILTDCLGVQESLN